MIALRFGRHIITGEPSDRDPRRARLLAARRWPISSPRRRGVLSGHWDERPIAGAFRRERGTFRAD